ncbi:hypothetical protein PIB30_008583, partial [Stylosanthes scabra]|nr:hypothetical protein [Stylosanthes scabra]
FISVLGWVVGKEGLFEDKSTVRASKRRTPTMRAWNGGGWTCEATSTLKSIKCTKERTNK